MSQKKSIGWADATWNPIKGLCPGNCWFCYARKFYKRFKWNPELRLQLEEYKLKKIPKGSRVFVCSTIDLFHHQIKPEWRARVFEVIEKYPDLTFQILTKYPRNVGGGGLLGNVWLGISLTGKSEAHQNYQRFKDFQRVWAALKFISFEPMMSFSCYPLDNIDWVIIGALTGHGNKLQPKREWINHYVKRCNDLGIPVFLKDNLKAVWGSNLIQQIPNAPWGYDFFESKEEEKMPKISKADKRDFDAHYEGPRDWYDYSEEAEEREEPEDETDSD